VPVYLRSSDHIVTSEHQIASASFFAPFDRLTEPFVRIATGDYRALKKKYGRNNALAAFIVSLNHELIHYWQWLETGRVWEAGVARKAVAMLRKYERTVDYP
jgi:hypothetical protein